MLDNYLNSLNTHDFAVASTLIYLLKKDVIMKANNDKSQEDSKDMLNVYDIVNIYLGVVEDVYIPFALKERPEEDYEFYINECSKLLENSEG